MGELRVYADEAGRDMDSISVQCVQGTAGRALPCEVSGSRRPASFAGPAIGRTGCGDAAVGSVRSIADCMICEICPDQIYRSAVG